MDATFATNLERDIEASVEVETSGTLADTTGTESGARAITRTGIKGSTNESNIILARIAGQARVVLDTTEGRNS